jgi:hypothetical protein
MATVAFLAFRDLLVPEARGVEVWLGFEVHGRAALLSAPLHWAIFAAGAWGFWRERPWATRAAALYCFYVALSHLVWSEASPNGQGWPMGIAQGGAIALPGILLWRARSRGAGRQLSPLPSGARP